MAKTSSTYLFHSLISTGEFVKKVFRVLHNKFSNADWYRRTHGGTRYLLEELIFKLEDSIFQANFEELESTFFSKRSMEQKVYVIEYWSYSSYNTVLQYWKILFSNLKIYSSSKYLVPPWVFLYQSALLNLLCNTWKSKFSQTPLLLGLLLSHSARGRSFCCHVL